MSKSIETFPSLGQRLQDVRKKFDLHLNKPYLNRLLDSIDESDHTRVVLQAVIMILGHNYMSDRTLHIVFDKESTIKRIKKWNKCKLQKHKILRIKNWMEFRPETFGEASGYKGDKLVHALRDWCIIMVANKNKATKKITNEEREIKSLRGSPKKVPTKTSTATANKLSVASDPQSHTKKATMPKPNSVAMEIRISKVEDKEIKKESEEMKKISDSTKKKLQVPAGSGSVSIVSTKKMKTFKKVNTKSVQCKALGIDKGTSMLRPKKLKTDDKSVGDHAEMNAVAVQTIKSRKNKVKRSHVAKAVAMRNTLSGMVTSIDDNLDILFQAKEQLLEARKELNQIMPYSNADIMEREEITEPEWDEERNFILQRIADDQCRLQNRLKSTQSMFFD